MFSFGFGLEETVKALEEKGLKLVERLGAKGNRDEWIIVQDSKYNLALISLMTGKDIDGKIQTVAMLEKLIDPQGVLF